MANALEDTQNEIDERNVPIHRVGIRALRHPVTVVDAVQGEPPPTVATVAMSVFLPAEKRGTHMSRFVSILSEHASQISVAAFPEVVRDVMARLEASEATVVFAFPLFITKSAPVTGSVGAIDYDVELNASVDAAGAITTRLSVAVPVTTLCPCSRNISDRGAHNQRGVVNLTVSGASLPSVHALIDIVESCGSAAMYSVLKRPDEKHVTELAYDNPVFVEDLVRNVALAMNDIQGVDSYEIEAENFESIHTHSAFALVKSDRLA